MFKKGFCAVSLGIVF